MRPDGPETDPTVILWGKNRAAINNPTWNCILVGRQSSVVTALHALIEPTDGPPLWDQFLAMWVKVLRGWEEHPSPTLPTAEAPLLIHALQTMKDSRVLQHPRVAVSSSRSPRNSHSQHTSARNNSRTQLALGDVKPFNFVPSQSMRSRICIHRSMCLTLHVVLYHLWRRHLFAQPYTLFTMSRESGQMSEWCPTRCPCRLQSAARNSPQLLVWSSSVGMNSAVSLSSPKKTP